MPFSNERRSRGESFEVSNVVVVVVINVLAWPRLACRCGFSIRG
jgi:hypothetical protein